MRQLRAVVPLVSFAFVFACGSAPAPKPPAAPVPAPSAPATSLADLAQGAKVQGFVPQAVYTDDDGRLRGARFVHARTQFVFDYLQIESAPQAMLYATTYPTSDDGEPHTQEHLLLGRGNKGRYLGNFEHVMFAESNAFTEQYRTYYDFDTVAGPDAFWPLFRTEVDTLLHPDYTDDEIRREVRDYGISKQPDGELALDEKGTVYNEMVRTSEGPDAQTWWEMGRLLYGPAHPLGWVSGGTPEGIRKLTAADIRRFHAAHYQLGNMAAVGAFAASIPLSTVLGRIGETLDAFATPGAQIAHFTTEADLPAPNAAALGTVKVVEYPYASAEHPGPALLAWPANRHLAPDERELLSDFLGAFGKGEGSTLYQKLIDQKTRVLDLGVTDVQSWVQRDGGQPVYVDVENVAPAHADEASLLALRKLVHDQLAAIAALPDGSPELAAFGERVKARIIERRRATDKFLDTPPRFGQRNTYAAWPEHLDDVNAAAGFRRSLTKKDAYDHALVVAGATKNPWRERLAAWGLLADPYGIMSRASPKERARLDDDREARTKAELARLTAASGASDPKEALRRRNADIEKITAGLERAEQDVPMPPVWSSPPMTMDDSLVWKADRVRGVPIVASTFDTMKSVTVGLVLRIDSLPEDALPYVAMLPNLLTDVGVVRGGVPVSYEEVRDRLRREVLALDVHWSVSFDKDRPEIVIVASGNDLEEAKRALGWARDVLATPDWRPENLARLRDVVKNKTTELDDIMTSSEEGWAQWLVAAYRKQDRPALTHAQAFLTRAYDVRRLSWMLARDSKEDATKAARFLSSLAAAGKKQDRASLGKLAKALAEEGAEKGPAAGAKDGANDLPAALAGYVKAAHALAPADRAFVAKAGADLGVLLGEIPDESLSADWASLCAQMAHDLQRSAADTLGALTRALATVRHVSGARAWIVGSAKNQEALKGDLENLFGALDPAPAPRATYAAGERVLERVRGRGALTPAGATIALVNPNTGSTTLVNSAPGADFDATGGVLVDSLAAGVFGGAGAQSLFKRIWASGLAYNGGIGVNPETGRISYYSDRIADAPQLVHVLSGYVQGAPADPRFVDYAVANAFWARVGNDYEWRAEAMASDLADGTTAERVRAFRQRLLALRSSPGLAESMHRRFVPVLAALLPPLAGRAPPPSGAVHFTIGPEARIAAYEAALRADGGSEATVVRIYPRDFWFTGEIAR
jgi:Zn-dependent M16 (insulinase) family peptidase